VHRVAKAAVMAVVVRATARLPASKRSNQGTAATRRRCPSATVPTAAAMHPRRANRTSHAVAPARPPGIELNVPRISV
jgi:hypothetical protein